jgi:hypothetical protein
MLNLLSDINPLLFSFCYELELFPHAVEEILIGNTSGKKYYK